MIPDFLLYKINIKIFISKTAYFCVGDPQDHLQVEWFVRSIDRTKLMIILMANLYYSETI